MTTEHFTQALDRAAAVSSETLCVRSKTKGEARLDDNKIHFFGARRANVAGLGALEPRVEVLELPKSVESGDLSVNQRPSSGLCR